MPNSPEMLFRGNNCLLLSPLQLAVSTENQYEKVIVVFYEPELDA